MKQLTILPLILFFFTACTIQKKIHRPGYHIEWKKRYATETSPGIDETVRPVASAAPGHKINTPISAEPAAETREVHETLRQPEKQADQQHRLPTLAGEWLAPVNDDTLYIDEEDVIELKEVTKDDIRSHRIAWTVFTIWLVVLFIVGGGILLLVVILSGASELLIGLILLGMLVLFIGIQLLFYLNAPQRKFARKMARAERKGVKVITADREKVVYKADDAPRQESKKSQKSGEVLAVLCVLAAAILAAVLLF